MCSGVICCLDSSSSHMLATATASSTSIQPHQFEESLLNHPFLQSCDQLSSLRIGMLSGPLGLLQLHRGTFGEEPMFYEHDLLE